VEEVEEIELHVERVAALDLGKSAMEACVRIPHPSRAGRRMQEVRPYQTTTAQLRSMIEWFREHGVTRVVMEATSDYWKGVYYLLEADGFEVWLVNPRDVKNLPGRAKTDKIDCVWLCKVAERGMCRPSLVHPPEIRRLRDLTRYRRALVQDQTWEKQRAEKLLEDAQIKISSVLSDIFGVSGRAMMGALIAGERDVRVMADLAERRARHKIEELQRALDGFFTDHHARILGMMLDNIDRMDAQIAALDAAIEETIAPFVHQVAQLCEVTGIDTVAASELIGEIGVDMSRFNTPAHLVSWAKFCPKTHESAGKKKAKGRGKGNPWLGGILGRVVFGLSRTHTFLGVRHRRLGRRMAPQKAIVASGNSVLTVVWHLLSDPGAHFNDLGPDYYDSRINKDRKVRSLARHLEAITGQKIAVRDGKVMVVELDIA
jgi:transposase